MLLNVGALQPAGTSAVTAFEHHPSHSDTHMQNATCRDKTEISENHEQVMGSLTSTGVFSSVFASRPELQFSCYLSVSAK